MSVLENHVSLTLPFRTSGSSLASDLSAELAELEANGVAPPVHVSHTVAKQRLLSSIQGEGSKVWAGMSKARAGGVVAGGAENHMDGNWAPEPEIGRRSLRHPNQTASVNWGGQESTRKAGMNGNPEMGNEEVTLRGVQSKIIRTKAALTEFLEELGLKEESANGAGNNVASWEDGEALSRGANLVRMLTVCVEEHGKLTAQLQLIRTEQGADCTDESAAESGSKRGGEGQAGSDLSFSNLVRRPGTAKGAAAGMQPMSGKGDEVQFEVGPAGRSGGAPEGDLMGLGVNPGSVDCSLSEDTDVVVMSDSEAEGPSEEGQLDREDVKGLGSNNRKTAACDEAKLCEQLLKVGEGMKNTAVYRGMGDSSAGAEKEECGREPAWGAEKASISERERWILTQLEQSEKRIQELQSEALADVAASHWALKNSAGETTEGGREGGGGDVADSDWPEETRAAATQFLQAMTAHLAGLFEEYHGLLAARWHDGRPSDGRQVAGAERVRLTGELKPEPSWDLLFSVEKLEVQAGGGALWAGPQTPPAGRVSGFELQSASATPGSEPQGYYDRAPNLDAGAVSYRYADIMLGASPESVACEGEPLRSVLSSPAGKNTRSAAAAFASWASAKPFFSDAGTQSELRELSDASVQCDLAPPVTRPLTVAQTGPKPTPLSSSPKASTDKFPSASLRYPPSQQPRPNPERRTISGRPALAPVSSNTLAVESPKQSPKVGRKRTSENRKVDVRRSPLEVRELGAREDKGIGGGDVLRRRCRTLECQVAALTGEYDVILVLLFEED